MTLENNGIVLDSTGNINQLNEIINGEVWERRDLTIRFNENVILPVPQLNKIAVADLEILTLVEED